MRATRRHAWTDGDAARGGGSDCCKKSEPCGADRRASAFIAHQHKGSVQLIREAKAEGSCDLRNVPALFYSDGGRIGDYDTFAKVNPPLRAKEDVYAIIEGIMMGRLMLLHRVTALQI